MLENQNDIIADPLSILALKYLNTTSERLKNKLFMEIAKHYMPKISKLLAKTPKQYHDDILQIYYLQLLKGLNNWGRTKANVSTYLYSYILAVPRIFMDEKEMFKQDICVTYMSNDLMSDVFLNDEDLWDRIIEQKFVIANNRKYEK